MKHNWTGCLALIDLLLIFALIPLGRWAGGAWRYNKAASPLIGIVLGLLLGVTWYFLPLFALAAWLGEKLGVGHPFGHLMGKHDDPCTYELERWEPEGLRDHPYVALSLRGFLNSLMYLPLVFVAAPVALVLLYAATWPMSAWLGGRLPKWTLWQWSELLRHTLLGLVLIGAQL